MYKTRGKGIVWDAENNRILARFKDGIFETKDEAIATKLSGLGYNVDGFQKSQYESLKVEELKKLCEEKGIEYDSKAKKEDLLKLLEGAE